MAICSYGVQQILIRDFRPQILPPFPAWVHQHSLLAILSGLAMLLFGVVVTGAVKSHWLPPAKLCLYLGFYFLFLLLTCQLPYLFFIFPHKLSHLGVWADLLKELAFCGGSFVMAGALFQDPSIQGADSPAKTLAAKLFPLGRLFFCTTLVLFGRSHFLYTEFISGMVPNWLGNPVFWTYAGGVALIGAGLAIAFRLFLRPVALLLAALLFLWFLLLHLPGAIADPGAGNGNLIVSAFDALLFCGTALALSPRQKEARRASPGRFFWGNGIQEKPARLS